MALERSQHATALERRKGLKSNASTFASAVPNTVGRSKSNAAAGVSGNTELAPVRQSIRHSCIDYKVIILTRNASGDLDIQSPMKSATKARVIGDRKADYANDGVAMSPRRVISREVARDARKALLAVSRGEFVTGQAPLPMHGWSPDQDQSQMATIQEAHRANKAILAVAEEPAFIAWLCDVLDAEWVQVWAILGTIKPAHGTKSSFGWHRDGPYWRWFQNPEETNAVFVALTDCEEKRGALRYVPRSHLWATGKDGNFFHDREDADLEARRNELKVPDGEIWRETVADMGEGYAAVHHAYTLHASGANTLSEPRINLTVSIRTNRAELNGFESEEEQTYNWMRGQCDPSEFYPLLKP